MADRAPTLPTHDATQAELRPGAWRAYHLVLASRIRSQRSYRTNFRIDLVSSLLVTVVELAEVLVLFSQVGAIGGLTLRQVLLVFGLSDLAFALSSAGFGHLDELSRFVRTGMVDVFYLRPQPVLAQLVTSDVHLRRLVRGLVSLGALAVGLVVAEVPATPRTAALVGLALLSGTAIFSAQYVGAAGLQFFLVQGAEATNAFVYGGRYAATQPASVWARPVRLLFGFVFPMAFCGYLPVLEILGLPGPALLPAWLAWWTPLAAVWAWLLAMGCWRRGSRHYQGAGG